LSDELVVPANITLLPLPPKCPELNPVENIWQFPVIGAKRESGREFEAERAGAEGVEQFGRNLAEPQALPHVLLRNPEAASDRFEERCLG
jgi:hypothetical protein